MALLRLVGLRKNAKDEEARVPRDDSGRGQIGSVVLNERQQRPLEKKRTQRMGILVEELLSKRSQKRGGIRREFVPQAISLYVT